MPTILSLETSTKVCSVAIHQNGKCLTINELHSEKSSSAMLTVMIHNALKITNLSFEEIDAVAVSKGPGSYTGLRIGVSTAKGLCFTLEKPLIAVNTLEAMAVQLSEFRIQDSEKIFTHSLIHSFTHLLCSMLDARRMEVYCAVFDAETLEEFLPTEAKIIDENSFSDLLLQHKIIFFGDGAEKCKSFLGENKNAIFLENLIYPSAKTVGILATKAFEKQDFEDLETFEPFYLKDFMTTTPKLPLM